MWQSVHSLLKTEKVTKIRIGIQQVLAVKVYLIENDKAEGVYRNAPIYGIYSLAVTAQGQPVSMQLCSDCTSKP